MQRLCTNRQSTESRNFSKLLHVNILNASRIVFKCLLKFIKMLMMNIHATSFRTARQNLSSMQKCKKLTTMWKKTNRHTEK